MAQDHVIETYALKMVLRAIGIVILIAVMAYPLDWVIWRARVAKGGGMGSVDVQLFTVAELKGGKEDYYPNGTALIACTESLYPQGGHGACWWVKRHREVIHRY